MLPTPDKKQHIARLRAYLLERSRPAKVLISATVDTIGFALCCIVATWLSGASLAGDMAVALFAATVLTSLSSAKLIGVYRSVVRFFNQVDLVRSAVAVSLLPSLLGSAVVFSQVQQATALRWTFSYFAFSSIYVIASRYFALWFFAGTSRPASERVIVYGAGAAGAQLLDALRANRRFRPVALVDDDTSLHGTRVKGIDVHSPEKIKALMQRLKASRVLLALPSVTRRRRKRILTHLAEEHVRVQTIPEIDEILSGRAQVSDVSDVEVKDILGRDPVRPNFKLLQASICDKSVLVTGAGGSIGSELCRQILPLAPKRLVIFEINEPALYALTNELAELRKSLSRRVEVVPLLGSVLHEARLREAIEAFDVKTVFHVAAYKHVPIVEHNVLEGIRNNVLGTLHSARAASDAGAQSFVLISTDKAVNPTNVMGATKRCAELILQAMNETSKTTMSIVRFGNVLASSGSVVPLFQKQIRAGGPVTVTHRDITRYFMTIPEAAQLVVQASAMAKGGDVFVLDMGKPVRIVDLAVRMIGLMGMSVRDSRDPDGDIAIEFVGLRPAEKLHEELLIGGNVTGTEHPRILRADEAFISWPQINEVVMRLADAIDKLDCERAHEILLSTVEEYAPASDMRDTIWSQRLAAVASDNADTVVEFPTPPKS